MSIEPITVSYSEITTGQQCKYKHYLAYDQRYSKAVEDDSPLGKGVLWHTIVQLRYDIIQNHQLMGADGTRAYTKTKEEVNDAALKAVDIYLLSLLKQGVDPELLDTLKWMHDGYVEVYGLDSDHWIVGVETTHFAPLGTIQVRDYGNDFGTIDVPVLLKFKIDRTVQDKTGQLKVIDEKSMSTLASTNDYNFNRQFMLYVWGLRKLGLNVRAAIHSAAKSKPNKGDLVKEGDDEWKSTMKPTPLESRFKRTPMPYTPAQLAGAARDALADVQELYGAHNARQRQMDEERCVRRCSFKEACYFGQRTGKDSDTIRMLELTGFVQNHERH